MLVLKRRRGQEIIVTVGDTRVSIMLCQIRGGDSAAIGIKADKEVSIHRKEVQDEIDARAKANA